MQTNDMYRGKVIDFIINNFLFGDASKAPESSASLIETGVIDSTGILELIQFMEESFGFTVEENETIPQNMDSVDNIVSFIKRKTGA